MRPNRVFMVSVLIDRPKSQQSILGFAALTVRYYSALLLCSSSSDFVLAPQAKYNYTEFDTYCMT